MKKKTLMVFTMLSLVVALAATSVSAQSRHYFQVTIPFEFAISGKTLPPGEYIVRRVSSDRPERLAISSANGVTGQSVVTHNVRAGMLQAESKLVFNRYGDHYFLSQIWEAGDNAGRELMKSREERQLERELAKTPNGPEKVAIVRRRN
jgi:hypothetical protein